VSGSIVLPEASRFLVLNGADPEFKIVLSNATPDSAGHVPGLSVQVIAHASCMKRAANEFRNVLADQLDLLTFATRCEFTIQQCWRVIEWEPYQKVRAFSMMQKFDPLYPPSPDLPAGLVATAQALIDLAPATYVRRALRYFRYGVLSEQAEDQFQQFWLAIETVAEGRKQPTKIPIQCAKCGGQMVCGSCHDVPMRTPMSRQAIRDLINVTVQPDADQIYRDLVTVRDRLAHGGSVEVAAAKTGKTMGHLVEIAGHLAWYSIRASMDQLDRSLPFGSMDKPFANGTMVVTPNGTFICRDGVEYPEESDIPTVKIEMNTTFRPPPATAGSFWTGTEDSGNSA
jgi:hypothetical protein